MILETSVAKHPILRVENLQKVFRVKAGRGSRHVHAVNGVTFSLAKGSVLAVVGESGSGKSTLIRLIAHLIPRTSGRIWLGDEEVPLKLGRAQLVRYRRRVQMIFQDPFGALNPYYPISYQLERPLSNLGQLRTRLERFREIVRVLEEVGLSPAQDYLPKRPHELSGGQRQRVVIARALIVSPEVVLADEPTSMLDVSIRMSILNLLDRLRQEHQLSYVFVTHDLASARYLSDHIMVMYAGQAVEGGLTDAVIDQAAHPYTRLLISAVPEPSREIPIANPEVSGEPPDLSRLPQGCPFHLRCPQAMERCRQDNPRPVSLDDEHWVACHLYG
ncbi:MAG: ABC transporter ATP-binding protein [Firmicutes bacterium]|nr:ABC transporter ATP-binding protein [Bacillota bacterium]